MAQDPGRVFPGKRMSGHLGNVQRTTQNLEILRIDVERGLLLIKGAIPGPRGGDVVVHPSIKTSKMNVNPVAETNTKETGKNSGQPNKRVGA